VSTQKRLSTTELAFWRVAKTSLSSWRSQSRITMGEQDSPHPKSTFYYPFSDLDAYHLEHLHPRYSSFPATAELWALQLSTGQPTLLTVPVRHAQECQLQTCPTLSILTIITFSV
jgi:hypothetical protein